MDDETVNELMQKRRAEDSIRADFEHTLPKRVDRYWQVKPHEIVPYTHFSAASAECSCLFRDGHFYGCIALAQAVAEALVRFMCETKLNRAKKVFERNVENLRRRGFISENVYEGLLRIWQRRDDYHHLNPEVATNRQTLEQLARDKTVDLVEVQKGVFRFGIVNGRITPEKPEYWVIEGDRAQVFLNLEP
ncbi:MAG: hypothetical protein SVP26_07705 [Chloroflexota bacterium]|nr:hypothetical protein [Chloroflexota bacterium]